MPPVPVVTKGVVTNPQPKPIQAVPKSVDKEVILYPTISINGIEISRDRLKITVQQAKDIIGWEDEEAYTKRTGKKLNDDFILKDSFGRKVQCWRNANNRPFKEVWADELCQKILNRQWELNLETIVISATGVVTSGQHRLIALIMACEKWCGVDRHHWQTPELWMEEPYIESLIAYGGSDDFKVISTVDNVMPRSESDVIYTSQIFAGISKPQRRECSKLLAATSDLLWKRTKAADSYNKYKTPQAMMDFIERHPRMLDCVNHLFEENGGKGKAVPEKEGRAINDMRLSPGACAGLMYLMGSCGTDGEDYHVAQPPQEEGLVDWDHYDQAAQFWAQLALGIDKGELKAVIHALGLLADPENGNGGRTVEKYAILCKAWNAYVESGVVTEEDVKLTYQENKDGRLVLIDDGGFDVGGIDVGPQLKAPEHIPTPEEIEARAKEARDQAVKEMEDKLKDKAEKEAKKTAPPPKPTTKPPVVAVTNGTGRGPNNEVLPTEKKADKAKKLTPPVSKLKGGTN